MGLGQIQTVSPIFLTSLSFRPVIWVTGGYPGSWAPGYMPHHIWLSTETLICFGGFCSGVLVSGSPSTSFHQPLEIATRERQVSR